MEEVTNEQYNDQKETLIRLILKIMQNSQTLEEAKEKVKALLPEKD